jgi:Site-specific DNA methylase
MSEKLTPFVKYPGGKGRELKYITPAIPKNITRYFEPFVGGGAVFFSFDRAFQFFINDKSKELITLYNKIQKRDSQFYTLLNEINTDWKFLEVDKIKIWENENFQKNVVKSLFRKEQFIKKQLYIGNDLSLENGKALYLTALKSAYYTTLRDVYNQNRKAKNFDDNAAYFYFIREFCYSSMFRFSRNGNFNVPYGGMSYNLKNFDSKLDYIQSPKLLEKLNQTQIYNLDFEIFLNQFDLTEQDFIFLDPPYDSEFSTYDENEFGQQEQIRLANFLKNTSAKWMIVIKDTEFIRSLYPKNNSNIFYNEFDKKYSVSFMNRNNRQVRHLMITNYQIEEDND